jgi:adenine-specific DNA-methyltransferase
MNQSISSKHQELVAKLREIFQIDRPELDFGIYRILNARASEINDYLQNRLADKVKHVLSSGSAANEQSLQAELDEAIKQAQALGANPDDLPKVKDLRAKLYEVSAGSNEHENAVFSHLLTFFSRYYDNGDFISQRRYKGDTYAIPYSGEEVMLHWANKDQYYTKSGENFANYSFKLPGQEGKPERTVHFRLVAADTTKDNRKDNGNDRRFVLLEPRTVTRLDEQGEAFEETLLPLEEIGGKSSGAGNELLIRFEYKAVPKGIKQDALVGKAVTAVLSDATVKVRWLDLGCRAPTEKNPQRTLLEKHLSDYTTKNSADYFIHKDLGGFLRRELDFYIKNEVMHMDDVQNANAFADIEKNLRMIQCLRSIAQELITFLAQLEDFQKKMWLKKKFVVSSHYCITLDRVSRNFYPEIVANDSQWSEWIELGLIEANAERDIKFLAETPFLMIDTSFFSTKFNSRLIAEIEDLQSFSNGLLIHGENFQGLQLLSKTFNERIKCVYLDPPYNTDVSAIPYKNNYRHSSWATMMNDKLKYIQPLMTNASACFVSIDKQERDSLVAAMDNAFGKDNRVEELIWIQNTNDGRAKTFSTNHEYVEVYSKNLNAAESDHRMFREPKPGFDEVMALITKLSSEFVSPQLAQEQIRDLYKIHYNELKSEAEAQGLDWETEKRNDPWKGVYQYKFCEYRDSRGQFCDFSKAEQLGAKLWVYRESDWTIMESDQKQSTTTKDPGHPNYRYYTPIHPLTGNPCSMPSRGWKGTFAIDTAHPDRNSWESLTADNRIAFGPDEKKVPQQKRFLHEVETNVAKSVVIDFADGEKETTNLFGRKGVFLAPKHTSFVGRFIQMATGQGDFVLDIFGGSGSTAGAVIESNRKDGFGRKFILMEVNAYIETTIIPRLKKTIFASRWRSGKPQSTDGLSAAFKVIRLESYEDTLNNLLLRKREGSGDLFGSLPKVAQDDYLMRYMLDVESRGSLLSVEDFKKPFDYSLNVAVDSAGAYEPRKVDMVETFNFLIGLRVKTIDAQLDRGFVLVTGTSPNGERCLILWRDCDMIDYEELRRMANRLDLEAANNPFDVIYINGDHNIPTSYTPTAGEDAAGWAHKIRQIEPEFLERMFSVEDI